MKQKSLNSLTHQLRICIALFIAVIISLFLFSFTIIKFNDGFLKQLGLQKNEANKKITNSILGGYMNAYEARNAKNILLGNRTAVAKDLLTYTKQYVNSTAFKNEYSALKESHKPRIEKLETPDEMRLNLIKSARECLALSEGYVKNADKNTKTIFDENLKYAQKNIKDAEDPNNKAVKAYAQNYPAFLKNSKESQQRALQEWETKYPANQLPFVKERLQQFLSETKDIDFSAELTDKKNKKVFVNPVYESKGYNWKMAFRAGKEVVEPAREFVQQWLDEIK